MSLGFLDLQTLSFVLMLTTIALGCVMAFIWKTQKVYPGFVLWTLCNFMAAVGFALLSLRGYAPDFISIVLGNSFAAGGIVLAAEGSRRFLGLNSSKLFTCGLLLIHAVGLTYFTFAENQIVNRIAISSITLAIVSGRSAYLFLTQPVTTPTYKFVSAAYSLFTFLMLVRLVLTYEYTKINDLFAPDWVQALVFLTFLLFAIVWMFGYLTLTSERLQNDLNAARANLEEVAATDFLTGIANSRRFHETGEIEIQRANRFQHTLTLIMFDLDFFKRINDNHGHAAGDRVLIETVAICRRDLRSVDLFGRLGGEEFAVLLPHTDLKGAITVAETLRTAIERLGIEIAPDEIISVTASFGITELKTTDTNLQIILDRADTLLYQAKNEGRNRLAADSLKAACKKAGG